MRGMAYVTKAKGRHIYQCHFKDHMGIPRRVQGFGAKAASIALARNLERLAAHVGSGAEPPVDLLDWVGQNMAPETRAKLAEWGLLSARSVASGAPLEDHLAQWRQHLLDTGAAPRHARQHHNQALEFFGACGFARYGDIEAPRVVAEFGALRKKKSPRTAQAYLISAKAFCRWMAKFKSLHHPLDSVSVPKVRATERTFRRRVLTPEEQGRLVDGAKASERPVRWMTGAERALLWEFMLATGLRADSVYRLTRGSFDLGAKPATVTAPVKGGKFVTVPLGTAIAAKLLDYLGAKHPDAPAFKLPSNRLWLVRALINDCREADIPTSGTGWRVDLHALRHTFGTTMARAGMNVHDLRAVMGHEEVETTLQFYTHSQLSDVAAMIEKSRSSCNAQRNGEYAKLG